jgi:hypothetical protein
MDDINDSNKEMVNLTTEELCDLLESLDFKIDYKEKDSEEDLQPRKKRRKIEKTSCTAIMLYKEAEPFCCLCGLNATKHAYAKHRFLKAKSELKCIACDKWFYQHKKDSPCFDPYVRM